MKQLNNKKPFSLKVTADRLSLLVLSIILCILAIATGQIFLAILIAVSEIIVLFKTRKEKNPITTLIDINLNK